MKINQTVGLLFVSGRKVDEDGDGDVAGSTASAQAPGAASGL